MSSLVVTPMPVVASCATMESKPEGITPTPAPRGSQNETPMESLPRRPAGVAKLKPKTERVFTIALTAKIATKAQMATVVIDEHCVCAVASLRRLSFIWQVLT